MKKIVIRISLLFILVAVFIVGSAMPISAAPPVRIYTNLTFVGPSATPGEGLIQYTYNWEKLGAYYCEIWMTRDGTTKIYDTDPVYLGGRTPSMIVNNGTFQSTQIQPGYFYAIHIRLFNKSGKELKRGYASDVLFYPFPP